MKVKEISYVVGSTTDFLTIESESTKVAVNMGKIVSISTTLSKTVEIKCVGNERIELEDVELSEVLNTISCCGDDNIY